MVKIHSANTNCLEGNLLNSFTYNFHHIKQINNIISDITLHNIILKNYNILLIKNNANYILDNYYFVITNNNLENTVLYFNFREKLKIKLYDLIKYDMNNYDIPSKSFYTIPYLLVNNNLLCTIYDQYSNVGVNIVLTPTRKSKQILNILPSNEYINQLEIFLDGTFADQI